MMVVYGGRTWCRWRAQIADTAGVSDEEVIEAGAELAADEFARQELAFDDLWGRPLQLIDCQNLFCETDKYAHVVHPHVLGQSGRAKIKQRFSASARPIPPKWGIRLRRSREMTHMCGRMTRVGGRSTHVGGRSVGRRSAHRSRSATSAALADPVARCSILEHSSALRPMTISRCSKCSAAFFRRR
jgi:hypothetical protein